MAEIRLDVSDLEPCEPLERALAAADSLAPGDYLRVLHRREPRLLFPLLEQRGCRWHCRQTAATRYEILVWRGDDEAAAAAAQRAGHDG